MKKGDTVILTFTLGDGGGDALGLVPQWLTEPPVLADSLKELPNSEQLYEDVWQAAGDVAEVLDGLTVEQRRELAQRCELCGERLKSDLLEEHGEFVDGERHVLAHAQCGLDRGLPLA